MSTADLRWDDAIQIVLDKTQLDHVRTEKQKAKKKSGDFTDADEDEGTAARSSHDRRRPNCPLSPAPLCCGLHLRGASRRRLARIAGRDTAGCAASLMRPAQWRTGWQTISGFRCGRRHDRRRTRRSHARCRPAFLGRAEPPPLEQEGAALGHQRRPHRRCRQGHMVRPRGRSQGGGVSIFSSASASAIRGNGCASTDTATPATAAQILSTRSSRVTTTPTNSERCCSRSSGSPRKHSANGGLTADGGWHLESLRASPAFSTACPT